METPTSTSLGALGSLLRKLREADLQPMELEEAMRSLIMIHDYIKKLSLLEEPTLKHKAWMKEVRELSYNMEDYMDRRKLMKAENQVVQEFSTHLQEAIERYKRYSLDDYSLLQYRYVHVGHKPTDYTDFADLLLGPTGELVKRCLMNDAQKLKVVAIVGPGGVGKTTLATKLYQTIGGEFDCRAFVRVTRRPDMKRLLRDLLSQLRRDQQVEASGALQLINSIKEHLRHRRYLIVMDDICATSLWQSIRRAIPDGSCGSRIIVTGEIEAVAFTCCNYHQDYIFKMECLSKESSEKLFSSIAFRSEDNFHDQVRDESLEIIEKSGGLPLTIVSIASLLSSFVANHQNDVTLVEEQWKQANHSLGSNLSRNFTSEITERALNLCYNNLPHHLKTCLLYLTIYPEDYTILKDDILKLWVAEDFITAAGAAGQDGGLEEAGKYFEELVQRRMIQPVYINDNNEVSSCTVHSMVLDLISNKSVEDNFIVVLDNYQGLIGLPEKVRRLSLHFGNSRHANVPERVSLSQVRSLAFFGFYKCIPPIKEFELVRVLVLQIWGDDHVIIVDLSAISELYHLRHLKIASDTSIKLPRIMRLKCLTTIEIDAMATGFVPSDIIHLPGLLHLLLPMETDMLDWIGHMSSLCTLGYLDLSKKDEVLSLRWLTTLQHLHLTCSDALSNHLEANLNTLGSIIESLGKLISVSLVSKFLRKKSLAHGPSAAQISWENISEPPPFLQKLELSPRICAFSSLPNWTRHLSKLCTLKIAVHKLKRTDVGVLEELSTLTILSLHVEKVPTECIGFRKAKFPHLEFFKFICSVPWLHFEEGTMPNLQKLHLGFNAHGAAASNHTPEGMMHLIRLQVLRGVIGCFQAEECDRSTAESALRNISGVHGTLPVVNIRWVDWNFYDNQRIFKTKGPVSSVKYPETRRTDREPKFQTGMSDWIMPTTLVVHVELYADRREVCSVATIPDSFVTSNINKMQQIIQAGKLGECNKEFTELLEKMRQIQKSLIAGRRIEVYITNIWLTYVEKTMSKADEIIYSLGTEGARESHSSSSSQSLIACIPVQFLCCVRPTTDAKITNPTTNTKISELQQRLKKLVHTEPIVKASPWIRNISHLLEPNLVGKEIINASEKLADFVIAHKEKKVHMLAIVGGGGVGKTTLAQKVYNHHKVRGTFSKQAWICVSREYSNSMLLKELLRNIGVPQEKESKTEVLRTKLLEAVKGKSLFLVLDDVYTYQVWTDLLETPLDAADTAQVFITTESREVAREIGVQYEVKLMTREDGWELFWKSMHINEENEVKNLKDIGMQIVDKCGGLPLAIKALAGVLATKDKTKKEWNKVLSNSAAWSMIGRPIELGAFYLSYEDLQPYLKKCFLYCSLFPEKWTLNRDDLVRFWVAEGFVEEKEDQLQEGLAEEYYYELIYRNLLETEPIHFGNQWCKMHNVLRQFALDLSNEFFAGDPESLDSKDLSKLRYISVVTGKNLVGFPAMGAGLKGVKTLIFNVENSTSIEPTVLKQFNDVNVLDLTGLLVQNITEDIGNLIHLRLLDLDGTDVSSIPESIGSLINLEVLNLQRCDSLHSLPCAITTLCNLRRLGLGGTPIDKVPEGIGNLAFLRDLEGFPIGSNRDSDTGMQDGWTLEELASLVQLRRLDVVKLGKALPCGTSSFLENKAHLKFIVLRCTEQVADEPYPDKDVRDIEKVFEQLIPPKSLEDLGIDRFFGQCYPTWLGTHMPSVKHLTLANCISCVDLPPLGQLPNLTYLRIVGATAVTRIGPEFVGHGVSNPSSSQALAFPKLEFLVVRDMANWEKWSFVENEGILHESTAGNQEVVLKILPCLKELQLVNCPKIRSLPPQLAQASSLKVLQLRRVDSLNELENLPYLSDILILATCKSLKTVSNLPLVRVLRLQKCPNLCSVENLENLQQVWLTKDMNAASSQWLPQLKKQHSKNLDVYTWR